MLKSFQKVRRVNILEFFDIFGKGASFMGTLLMGITTQITDNSKYGVVVIACMFVIGGIIFKSKCHNQAD